MDAAASMDVDPAEAGEEIILLFLLLCGPGDVDALQREFADWFPGPVLLPVGTEVRLIPQQDTAYRNLVGAVREHLATDPRIVKVDLPATEDAEEETVSVLYSILRLGKNAAETMAREKEQSREMQERTTQLLSESPAAGAGARFTVIGYNEFHCGGKAEREYWVCLDPPTPLRVAAGQIPMHASHDGMRSFEWCVLHFQYSGSDPSPAMVQRVAVRVTKTIELRAHQDKCRPCEVCTGRGSGQKYE
jgi:hypothetical protein